MRNNNIDGGNGSDTYYLFANKNAQPFTEDSIIKDTGKGASDTDTAFIYSTKDKIKIWFNIDRNQKTNYTLNITENGNDKYTEIGYATLSGVEEVIVKDIDDSNGIDPTVRYNYHNDSLLGQVASFLTTNNYKDAAQVFTSGSDEDQENLMAIYNNDAYWETV